MYVGRAVRDEPDLVRVAFQQALINLHCLRLRRPAAGAAPNRLEAGNDGCGVRQLGIAIGELDPDTPSDGTVSTRPPRRAPLS